MSGRSNWRRNCEPEHSDVQISPLPQQYPVRKLLAESKPSVLRKAEDIKFVVVYELRTTLLDEVPLHITEVLGPEVQRALGKLLSGFVGIVGHGFSVMRRGGAKNTSPLLCVLGERS
jgi:hypothetical protein